MVQVHQSSPKLYETVRLNSMEENYRYKLVVIGSSPIAATMVRNSKVEYPAFNRGVRVRFPAGQQNFEC